jgi:23S rRNA (uracil1939-C5)-methyltransferase
LASEKTTYYRNKLEYTFSDQRWLHETDMNPKEKLNLNGLGFHIPKRFDKILNIDHCYLQPDPSNDIRLWIKTYAEENGLTFFNLREQTGFLRNVMIRNTTAGELMVLMIVAEDKPKETNDLMENLENQKEQPHKKRKYDEKEDFKQEIESCCRENLLSLLKYFIQDKRANLETKNELY